MASESKEEMLKKISENRGYSLEMHRIMAEVDMGWVTSYNQFIDATYTGQRNISSQPPNSSPERAVPELNRLGLEHFGFHVEDLESEMARFEAEGIRVILPLTVTPQGIKLAYIEGPDDVVIELVQAAP